MKMRKKQHKLTSNLGEAEFLIIIIAQWPWHRDTPYKIKWKIKYWVKGECGKNEASSFILIYLFSALPSSSVRPSTIREKIKKVRKIKCKKVSIKKDKLQPYASSMHVFMIFAWSNVAKGLKFNFKNEETEHTTWG